MKKIPACKKLKCDYQSLMCLLQRMFYLRNKKTETTPIAKYANKNLLFL